MGRHKATKEQRLESQKNAEQREKNGENIKVPSLKKITSKKQLTPDERERLRTAVVAHFGNAYVEKRLISCVNLKEISEALKQMFNLMQKQVEEERKEAETYLKTISNEHRKLIRPKSVFNWRECEYLCGLGCTMAEIAGFFQIHPNTLGIYIKDEYGITFSEYYEKYSQGIKVSLRRAQIMKALEGDSQLLKFLGKNYLGQKDKVDFDGEVKGVNTFADLVSNIAAEAAKHKTEDEIKADEEAMQKAREADNKSDFDPNQDQE